MYVQYFAKGAPIDAILISSKVNASPGTHDIMVPLVLKLFLIKFIFQLCPCLYGGGMQSPASDIWINGSGHETITLMSEKFGHMRTIPGANLVLTLYVTICKTNEALEA
jgi:hypothetical protein